MVDFNLDEGLPVKNNDIALLLQQIDILFDTREKDVLGFEQFGTKYDTYLYDLGLSSEELKREVMSDLSSLTLFGFIPSVEVYLLRGSEQDIALIDIILTRENENYRRTYKIA